MSCSVFMQTHLESAPQLKSSVMCYSRKQAPIFWHRQHEQMAHDVMPRAGQLAPSLALSLPLFRTRLQMPAAGLCVTYTLLQCQAGGGTPPGQAETALLLEVEPADNASTAGLAHAARQLRLTGEAAELVRRRKEICQALSCSCLSTARTCKMHLCKQ